MSYEAEFLVAYPPIPDSWDEAIEFGIELRRAGDLRGNWQLGWLAMFLYQRSRNDPKILEQMAAAIGEAAITLKKKCWVASGYRPDEVADYPTLSFTHFQVVRSLVDVDPEEARRLLEEAANNNWTVERLSEEVREAPPGTAAALRIEGVLNTLHVLPLSVTLDDGTDVIVSVTYSLRDPKDESALRVLNHVRTKLARLLNPRLPTGLRVAQESEMSFQVGVALPGAMGAAWAQSLDDLNLMGAFVRASFVRPT